MQQNNCCCLQAQLPLHWQAGATLEGETTADLIWEGDVGGDALGCKRDRVAQHWRQAQWQQLVELLQQNKQAELAEVQDEAVKASALAKSRLVDVIWHQIRLSWTL